MDLTNKWKLDFDIILKLTFKFKAQDLFFCLHFCKKEG